MLLVIPVSDTLDQTTPSAEVNLVVPRNTTNSLLIGNCPAIGAPVLSQLIVWFSFTKPTEILSLPSFKA